MPRVVIKTGIVGSDGRETVLEDYLCDWPGCPEVAEHVVGVVREIATAVVLCDRHAVNPHARVEDDTA